MSASPPLGETDLTQFEPEVTSVALDLSGVAGQVDLIGAVVDQRERAGVGVEVGALYDDELVPDGLGDPDIGDAGRRLGLERLVARDRLPVLVDDNRPA
jgi:hypothetical protein